MKKVLLFCLALGLGCCLASCKSAPALDPAAAAYVGEWKANSLAFVMDGVERYEVSVLRLNDDGTGSYKGKKMTWTLSEETNTIDVTLREGDLNAALQIGQKDGKTVLTFYQDVYYRAAEFVEQK